MAYGQQQDSTRKTPLFDTAITFRRVEHTVFVYLITIIKLKFQAECFSLYALLSKSAHSLNEITISTRFTR